MGLLDLLESCCSMKSNKSMQLVKMTESPNDARETPNMKIDENEPSSRPISHISSSPYRRCTSEDRARSVRFADDTYDFQSAKKPVGRRAFTAETVPRRVLSTSGSSYNVNVGNLGEEFLQHMGGVGERMGSFGGKLMEVFDLKEDWGDVVQMKDKVESDVQSTLERGLNSSDGSNGKTESATTIVQLDKKGDEGMKQPPQEKNNAPSKHGLKQILLEI